MTLPEMLEIADTHHVTHKPHLLELQQPGLACGTCTTLGRDNGNQWGMFQQRGSMLFGGNHQ
jgi:hypothetical protein